MKIAFIPPWYGPNIPGGAEAETRRTAEHLSEAGVEVEVLTTCVKDFNADWAHNYHKPGVYRENDVLVRRFPVRRRDRHAFDRVNLRLMAQQRITSKEEEIYIGESVRSPELTTYIAAHQQDYLYFFIPYLFGTTYWGIRVCDRNAFLIPCLHDESYAQMSIFRDMFSRAAGVVLHTEPEMQLAKELYALADEKMHLIGEGVDTQWTADPTMFREKYALTAPFILYAGRKDQGKNIDLLIKYFRHYRKTVQGNLALVLLGGGELPVPIAEDEGIYDLGFVPVQDKYNAYAAADVFCQPSSQESFSLVLMESWLAQTPALVYEKCAVTTDHCVRSDGGLYFKDYAEFKLCLDVLLSRPVLRRKLGQNGRRYVWNNFRWDVIVERYLTLFNSLGVC